MSVKQDFIPGLTIGECITPAELELLVRNAVPEEQISLFYYGTEAPDVVSNPRYTRYIWIDTNTSVPTRRYWNGTEWAFWGFAPQTLHGSALIDSSVSILALDAGEDNEGKVIRVSESSTFYFTEPVDLFDNNELPVNVLSLGPERSILYTDGTEVVWTDADNLILSTVDTLVKKRVQYSVDTGSGAFFDFTLEQDVDDYADLTGVLLVMRISHPSGLTARLRIRKTDGTLIDGAGIEIVDSGLLPIGVNMFQAGRAVVLSYVDGKFQVLSPIPKDPQLNNVATYRSTNTTVPVSGAVMEFEHGLEKIPEIIQVKLVRTGGDFTHAPSGKIIEQNAEINAEIVWSYKRGSDADQFFPCFRPWADSEKIYVHVFRAFGMGMIWHWLPKNSDSSNTTWGSLTPGGDVSGWRVRVAAISFNPSQLGGSGGGSSGSGTPSPSILTDIVDQTQTEGAQFSFTVVGKFGIGVVWTFDETEVSGARFNVVTSGLEDITSTLTFDAELTDDGKIVKAEVIGTGGAVFSSDAELTVTPL